MNIPSSTSRRPVFHARGDEHHLHACASAGVDEADARGMARECFDRIDFLENRLSRFIDGSDVSRINRMAAGETLYLSEACHQCLLLALDAAARTGGLVRHHARHPHRTSEIRRGGPAAATRRQAHHSSGHRRHHLRRARPRDRPRRHRQGLRARSAQATCSPTGASETRCSPPAPARCSPSARGHGRSISPANRKRCASTWRTQSLSASGTGIQGSHIVHPWGPEAMPAETYKRVWVTAPTAALAEVWSTALMLLDARRDRGFASPARTRSEASTPSGRGGS